MLEFIFEKRYNRRLVDGSVALQKCGLPEQEIIDDVRTLKNSPPNYWTLILAKRKKGDVPQEM